jgi:hypothetical protein
MSTPKYRNGGMKHKIFSNLITLMMQQEKSQTADKPGAC